MTSGNTRCPEARTEECAEHWRDGMGRAQTQGFEALAVREVEVRSGTLRRKLIGDEDGGPPAVDGVADQLDRATVRETG